MRHLIAVPATLCLIASGACAQQTNAMLISALASGSSVANAATLVLTTSVDAPPGSRIVCYAAQSGSDAINSMTDTASNIYNASAQVVPTGAKARFLRGIVTTDLPIGGTITFTYSAADTNPKLAACVVIVGRTPGPVVGFDANPAGTTGTSTTPSIASGALASATEIIFGAEIIVAGAGDTFTEATGWTSLTPVASTAELRWAYQVVQSAVGVTYAPTLGTSRVWGQSLFSLKNLPCTLSAMGAGAC